MHAHFDNKMKWLFFLILVCFMMIDPADVCAERRCVNVPTANVRARPEEKAPVLWQIERYHPVFVVEKKGSWYRFRDYENDEGWIHQSLLDGNNCVITKMNKGNIRSGPATSHSILFTFEKGIPFKVLKKQGDWFFIEHSDGDRGWIHKSLVW
jgi:SH3-like domain-containing protein